MNGRYNNNMRQTRSPIKAEARRKIDAVSALFARRGRDVWNNVYIVRIHLYMHVLYFVYACISLYISIGYVVCMHWSMYVCVRIQATFMYIFTHVYICLCILNMCRYVCMYVLMCLCTYVYMYEITCVCTVYVSIYVCMYVCMSLSPSLSLVEERRWTYMDIQMTLRNAIQGPLWRPKSHELFHIIFINRVGQIWAVKTNN